MPEAPSTDLEVRRDVAAMTDEELNRTYRIAKALALSRRFPDARTADEAMAKILVGRDLGLSPTQALTGLHIVEGKPQIAAVTLAGFVKKSADYNYTITEHTDQSCAIRFYESGEDVGTSTFTIDEARAAGLVKERSNWIKWPKNMLFARAMSNGVKWFCPDLMGGVPIYTEGDVFEGTAAEIGSGQGDGSEPGWGDTRVANAAVVEGIIARAQDLGHAGLSDRATAQMTLSGQPDSVVAMWCERAGRELDEFEVRQREVDEVRDREASAGAAEQMATPMNESEPSEALREQLNAVLDRIIAEEKAGADEAVMGPLYAERDRLAGLLGDEPGDEGQETMPL
jgi:hypothetical protein